MSNPIQLIRDGIDKANWSLVCEGYSQMTGDDVIVPQSNNTDKIVVMINGSTVYHSGTTNLEEANKQLEEESQESEDDSGGGIFNTSTAESKKLSKARKGKVREVRERFTLVKVKCGGCRGNFEVHPDLVPRKLDKDDDEPEFRCDSCMGKSKIK